MDFRTSLFCNIISALSENQKLLGDHSIPTSDRRKILTWIWHLYLRAYGVETSKERMKTQIRYGHLYRIVLIALITGLLGELF